MFSDLLHSHLARLGPGLAPRDPDGWGNVAQQETPWEEDPGEGAGQEAKSSIQGEVMDTLIRIHQPINPFWYQKRPQDFHTYLNVPQEDFIPSCTTGSWSFPGKIAFPLYSHQHYLRLAGTPLGSVSFAAARPDEAVSLGSEAP